MVQWFWPSAGSGALSATVHVWDLLKEFTIIFITSAIVWSVPGFGKSPGEGNSYPLQYSCLDNSMDRRAWQAILFMGSQIVRHD